MVKTGIARAYDYNRRPRAMDRQVADPMSWETLRRLASFRAQRGCAISLYLNLDPTLAATASDVATRINSLLGEGERSEAATSARLDHEQRLGLKADFGRL